PASALAAVARKNGARFRYETDVTQIETRRGRVTGVVLDGGERLQASAIVYNADPAALGAGLFGTDARRAVRAVPPGKRSLSALVWLVNGTTGGVPLEHHNIFFSGDYASEFADIDAGRVPGAPTAYVCALDHQDHQDQQARPDPAAPARQRLQIIVNAPANGDTHDYSSGETASCTSNMLTRLNACGLQLEDPLPHRLVTPNDFSKRFPATGGALYGRASHGWAASFLRPGCRTRIRGLYLAGGGTHPGAGVPMAALSGQLASEAVLSDRISTRWYHRGAIAGGMSTRSAMTGASG
ncbi:MAG: FAD-dependent oxidoreductase, partial [Pseudomonadota bacterium]